MTNDTNNSKILFFSVLAIILFGLGVFIWKNLNESTPSNPIIVNQNWQNTNNLENYQTIQDVIDAWDPNEAIDLIYDEVNSGSGNEASIHNFDLLMAAYMNLWKYDRVIEVWAEAYDFLDSRDNYVSADKAYIMIDSYLIQAYIFSWDLVNARKYLDKHPNNIERLIFPRVLYEYKNGNYKGVTNLRNTISRAADNQLWPSLDLLAKSYIKLWETPRAIDIYLELYSVSNRLENEDDMVSAILFWYVASKRLKELYLEKGDEAQTQKFENEYLRFKWYVDEWKFMETEIAIFILNRQNDL
jgi:hypothetical protein